MGWMSEYEWASPMQTTVSDWEVFLGLCQPSTHLDIDALYKEFKAGARIPSEKYITRPTKKGDA